MQFKKTIQAVRRYDASGDYDMTFAVGDKFSVLADDDPEWYEAKRLDKKSGHHYRKDYGMVPKSFFAIVDAQQSHSQPGLRGATDRKQQPQPSPPRRRSSANSIPPLAIVLYAFQAEQPDEMTVNVGESVLLLARAEGWYLAKHIARAEPPGLIPSTYVSVRNMAPLLGMDGSAGGDHLSLPTIKEWNERQPQLLSINGGSDEKLSIPNVLSHEVEEAAWNRLLTARILSYQCCDGGTIVYKLDIRRAGDVRHHINRTFEELYTLQRLLLENFPVEAGRKVQKRSLPYFPSPAADLSVAVCTQRKCDINAYLEKLLTMPSNVRCSGIVVDFFKPWPLDLQVKGLVTEKPVDDLSYDSMAACAVKGRKKSSSSEKAQKKASKAANKAATEKAKKATLPPRLKLPKIASGTVNGHDAESNNGRRQPSPMLISAPLVNAGSTVFNPLGRSKSAVTETAGSLAAIDESAKLGEAVPVPRPTAPGSGQHHNSSTLTGQNHQQQPQKITVQQQKQQHRPAEHGDPAVNKYIKVKVIESEVISYFKITRSTKLSSLRRKMHSSLGIHPESRIYYEDKSDGRIKPLVSAADFETALTGGGTNVIIHT